VILHSSGHYFYIESSAPRTKGQKARLLSQSTHGGGTACLTFYYNMYGSHLGSLNVYTKVGSSLGTPIWTRSANQGNKWNVAQVTVKAQYAFQVRNIFTILTILQFWLICCMCNLSRCIDIYANPALYIMDIIIIDLICTVL